MKCLKETEQNLMGLQDNARIRALDDERPMLLRQMTHAQDCEPGKATEECEPQQRSTINLRRILFKHKIRGRDSQFAATLGTDWISQRADRSVPIHELENAIKLLQYELDAARKRSKLLDEGLNCDGQ